MFVGHAALAFALGVLAVERRGWSRDRVLIFGVVAGLFAVVPDVDVLSAIVDLPALLASGPTDLPTAFWTRSAPVHRAMTHSLVVAVPAALAFGLWAHSRRGRVVAVVALAGLVGVAVAASGPVGGSTMAAFAVAGLAVAAIAAGRGMVRRSTAAAALLGLASHPFGDLLTGRPPGLLYPLDVTVLTARVGPFTDPTHDLLFAFGVELAAIWLAVLAAARPYDYRPFDLVASRATVGAGFALVVPVLPAPTLDVSYHFVYSVLAVGTVGVAPTTLSWRLRLPTPARAVATGLAAVTLAWIAFTVAYTLG